MIQTTNRATLNLRTHQTRDEDALQVCAAVTLAAPQIQKVPNPNMMKVHPLTVSMFAEKIS